jgi:hypothetical protein
MDKVAKSEERQGRVEIRSPIRYEIELADQWDGSWLLNYKEYFKERDWIEARKDSAEIFEKIRNLVDVKMDDVKHIVSITMRAKKTKIMNILASEFMSFSDLGEMNLKNLLGLVIARSTQMDISKERNDYLEG